MKVIVHIGMHKAASSSIQNFVRDNGEVLERHGVIVPRGRSGDLRTKRLVYEVFEDSKIRGLSDHQLDHHGKDWMKKIEEIYRTHEADPKSKILFLSSEAFENHANGQRRFSKLLNWLGGFASEVDFMAVIRDQASYLNSRYCQGAKTLQRSKSFEESLPRMLARNRLDYNRRFRGVLKSGKSFNAVPFSRLVGSGIERELIHHVLGVGQQSIYGELVPARRSNPNPGVKTVAAGVEIRRKIAEKLGGKAFPENVRLRLTKELNRMAVRRGWRATPYCGLDNKRACKITDKFAAINDAFAQAVWGCDWSAMYQPRDFSLRTFEFDRASPEEQEEYLDVTRHIVERFDELMQEHDTRSSEG